jgi:hydroxymethylpyrimidine/phosphomethylpyrimidine kinase
MPDIHFHLIDRIWWYYTVHKTTEQAESFVFAGEDNNMRQKDENTPSISPVVLVASGFDPTGSAGLIADVRVLTSLGCHPCGVVTCQTVQSSKGLFSICATDAGLLTNQLDAFLDDDIIPSAVKIGALRSIETIVALRKALERIPKVPVVLDPVFSPTKGPAFLDFDGMTSMSIELMPRVTLATPNISELGAPAGLKIDQADDEMIMGCAGGWFMTGVKNILVTGLVREGEMVDRLLWPSASHDVESADFKHPRHDVCEVHGTGCVLSSAIAGYLAKGEELRVAVEHGIMFTSDAIAKARKYGAGVYFWGI